MEKKQKTNTDTTLKLEADIRVLKRQIEYLFLDLSDHEEKYLILLDRDKE